MHESGPPAAHHDGAGDATNSGPIEVYPGTPRWVKIAGIIAAVVILLVILVHLTGVAPSAHVAPVEHGVQQP